MTRETKVGLVVACSFLCLVGIVVASKWRRGDDGTNGTEQQENKVAAVKEGQPNVPAPELPKNEIRPLETGVARLPVNALPPNTGDPVVPQLQEQVKLQSTAPPSPLIPPPLPLEVTDKLKPFSPEGITLPPPPTAPITSGPPPLPSPPLNLPPEVRPTGGTEIAQLPNQKPIVPLSALPTDPAPMSGGLPLPALPKEPVAKDAPPVMPILPGPPPGLPLPKEPARGVADVPPPGLPMDPLPAFPAPKDSLPVKKGPPSANPVQPTDPLPALPVQPKDPAPVFAPKEPPPPILKNPAPISDPVPVMQPQPIPTIPREAVPATAPIVLKPRPEVKETTLNYFECQRGLDTFVNLSMAFYGTDRYADALQRFNFDNSKMIPNGSHLTVSPPVLAPGQKVLRPDKDLLDRDYARLIHATAPAPVNPAPAPAVKMMQPTPLTPTPNPVMSTPVVGGVYKVQNPNGESILDIAERTLGNRSRWTAIYDLNRTNPAVQPQFRIPVGTELKMPVN